MLQMQLDDDIKKLSNYTEDYCYGQLLMPFHEEYNGNLPRFKRVNNENPSLFERDDTIDKPWYIQCEDGDLIVWLKLPYHYSINVNGVIKDRALSYSIRTHELQPEWLGFVRGKFGIQNILTDISNY